MTPRLSKEFKEHASELILNKSRQLISENFETNKEDKTISVNNEQLKVEIRRNCFTHRERYFEDYGVYFVTTIRNVKICACFYLEWEKGVVNTELIRPNGEKIKIRKCV